MKTHFFVAAVMLAAGFAYAQQPQQQFTACSQVAEFNKQTCVTNVGNRTAVCYHNIEDARQKCLQTGTYVGATKTYSNLRKE